MTYGTSPAKHALESLKELNALPPDQRRTAIRHFARLYWIDGPQCVGWCDLDAHAQETSSAGRDR